MKLDLPGLRRRYREELFERHMSFGDNHGIRQASLQVAQRGAV